MERTTVSFEPGLIRKIRQMAMAKSTTISHLINELLWLVIQSKPSAKKPYHLNWKPFRGGLRPGVDIADRDALYEIMEGRR